MTQNLLTDDNAIVGTRKCGCNWQTCVIGIEDSGAGVVSIRLAGFAAIGMSGVNRLLHSYCNSFDEVLKIIDGN